MKTFGNLIQLIIWWIEDFLAFLPKLIGLLIIIGVAITLIVMFPILLLFILMGFGYWLVSR